MDIETIFSISSELVVEVSSSLRTIQDELAIKAKDANVDIQTRTRISYEINKVRKLIEAVDGVLPEARLQARDAINEIDSILDEISRVKSLFLSKWLQNVAIVQSEILRGETNIRNLIRLGTASNTNAVRQAAITLNDLSSKFGRVFVNGTQSSYEIKRERELKIGMKDMHIKIQNALSLLHDWGSDNLILKSGSPVNAVYNTERKHLSLTWVKAQTLLGNAQMVALLPALNNQSHQIGEASSGYEVVAAFFNPAKVPTLEMVQVYSSPSAQKFSVVNTFNGVDRLAPGAYDVPLFAAQTLAHDPTDVLTAIFALHVKQSHGTTLATPPVLNGVQSSPLKTFTFTVFFSGQATAIVKSITTVFEEIESTQFIVPLPVGVDFEVRLTGIADADGTVLATTGDSFFFWLTDHDAYVRKTDVLQSFPRITYYDENGYKVLDENDTFGSLYNELTSGRAFYPDLDLIEYLADTYLPRISDFRDITTMLFESNESNKPRLLNKYRLLLGNGMTDIQLVNYVTNPLAWLVNSSLIGAGVVRYRKLNTELLRDIALMKLQSTVDEEVQTMLELRKEL